MTFAGFGQWIGSAEVFDGNGRFVGNGMDVRRVQRVDDCRTRIDVAFVGPFKIAGHYFIHDCGDHRLYEGPVNIGYAEVLGEGLVDANAYWPSLGLSQRFFLMILPDGNTQLSLALMTRGEQLIYSVVGQNRRLIEDASLPDVVIGTSHDLFNDPTAGRGALLLHRAGMWCGELTALDAQRRWLGTATYRETFSPTFEVAIEGGMFDPARRCFGFKTNGWQAWTEPGGEVAGSCSLSGGRALHGQFHHLQAQLRAWRREVVAHDGSRKAVLRMWYRGGERIGIEYGILEFTGWESE